LILRWKGIVPPATQLANPNTITSIEDIKNIYLIHIGYTSTLISFYLLPLILFTGNYMEIKKKFKEFIFNKKVIFFTLIPIAYIIFIYLNFNFEKITVTDYWLGYGVVHKLTILATNEIFLREIITYIFFFFSFMLILYFYYLNKKDFLLILYFILISLFLWPLMQEYFDPIVFIIAVALFKSLKIVNKINLSILTFYQVIFLTIANFYYN